MIKASCDKGVTSIEVNGTGIVLLSEAGVIVKRLRDIFKEHNVCSAFDMSILAIMSGEIDRLSEEHKEDEEDEDDSL